MPIFKCDGNEAQLSEAVLSGFWSGIIWRIARRTFRNA